MNLSRLIQPGRDYVLFVSGRQYEGRVVRVDAIHVEVLCDGRAHRLAVRDVHAVLEPTAFHGGMMQSAQEFEVS